MSLLVSLRGRISGRKEECPAGQNPSQPWDILLSPWKSNFMGLDRVHQECNEVKNKSTNANK